MRGITYITESYENSIAPSCTDDESTVTSVQSAGPTSMFANSIAFQIRDQLIHHEGSAQGGHTLTKRQKRKKREAEGSIHSRYQRFLHEGPRRGDGCYNEQGAQSTIDRAMREAYPRLYEHKRLESIFAEAGTDQWHENRRNLLKSR